MGVDSHQTTEWQRNCRPVVFHYDECKEKCIMQSGIRFPQIDEMVAPRFSPVSVVKKTWATFRNAPGLYIILAIIGTTPAIVLDFLLPRSFPLRGNMVYVISAFFTCVFEGAATYAVYRSLSGSPAGMTECLQKGLKRYFSLAGIAFITSLIILAGNMLYVLPGWIALSLIAVSVPACVAEDLGVWASFRRSLCLAKGCFGRVIGVTILYFVVVTACLTGTLIILLFTAKERGMDIYSFAAHFVLIVPEALWLVMVSVMYFELRTVKENVTVRKMIDVFA